MDAVPAITYVGHSTVLIELDGVRILTDPLLRGRVAHMRRIAPPPRVADLLPVDAVLVSHAHHDHLDLPSLRQVGRDTPVLAAAACGPLLRRRGFTAVTELEEGERMPVDSVDVLAVPAVHDGRRYPVGRRAAAAGFVIEGSRRIYFAGDTDVFDGMRRFAGGVDLALLPVWGWGPRLPAGHMDPDGAARAAAIVRPRVAVPVHWGTYAAPRVPWLDDPAAPAREFGRRAGELAPGVDVRILAPGERLALERPAGGGS
jgi:L-ascorbate metabolism protein UlaG (beta-lactamase superfamily)